MEKKTKAKSLSIFGLVVFASFIIGATFAYYGVDGDDFDTFNPYEVMTNAPDYLSFSVGDPLEIVADQDTFTREDGNLRAETWVKATLATNGKTNQGYNKYSAFLTITGNGFTYSTEEHTPEIILTITNPDGDIVTDLGGLTAVSVEDDDGSTLVGFDITEYTGILTLAENEFIRGEGLVERTWGIKITLMNLETDQFANGGVKMIAEASVTKGEMTLEESRNTLANYIKNMHLFEGSNGLYHHDGSYLDTYGNVVDANDDSYRYSGGDYSLTTQAIDESYSSIYDGLIRFTCKYYQYGVGSTCNQSYDHYYTLAYDTNNTPYANLNDALEQAIKDGYITKNHIRNFICFGTDAAICPDKNLYRIIGIFGDKVKLIKDDYATVEDLGDNSISTDYYGGSYLFYSGKKSNQEPVSLYYWNFANQTETHNQTYHYNVWSYSKLNTDHLNDYYLNRTLNGWQDKIDMTTWYVDGTDYSYSLRFLYNKELGEGKSTDTTYFEPYDAKIGTLYLSEFGFAADREYWKTTNLSSYSVTREHNWMYNGVDEMTISRYNSNSDNSYIVNYINYFGNSTTLYPYSTSIAVRPTFTLASSVEYAGGSGTRENPYRIA